MCALLGSEARRVDSRLLHTMAVLQGYQADLLKELDEGQEINSDITRASGLLRAGPSGVERG